MQRDTKQRRAIRKVVKEANRPLSPDEILAAAQRLLPGLGQATVYRTLNSMRQQRQIVPVEIPGQTARYEKSGLKHHHHFACTGCGRVFELQGCAYAGDKHVPAGFEVEGHELILYGQCRACHA